LEAGNRILAETVTSVINETFEGEEEKREPMDVRLCDFDDVSYRVTIEADARNILKVSMAAPCMSQISDVGAQVAIDELYKDISVEAVGGMDVTLSIDLDELKEDAEKKAMIERIKLMRANIVGGVFTYFCKELDAGRKPDSFNFQLRSDTQVYVYPAKDRVVFIYSLDYPNKAERCIAKIFMQEFKDAKKRIGKAPPVNFSAVPPREMQDDGIEEATCNLGYISFAILKPHVENDKIRTRVCQQLMAFRTYMQYHIKCSKSYFHARMRARCRELLKVLDRARIKEDEVGGKKKIKRTAAGKVFKRH